jgi:glycosyltransferase involved in cell wall biosynthesis
LYVGYLSSFKGPQYLVEVLPKLEKNVVLEIVGNGPLKPYLERRARELKVNDRVKFFEHLPRQELLQKYADADVFVMLSMHEAYSLVVAEALAVGVPCIVAKASALEEWVDNKNCFGIALPANLIELARLINNLLEHRARSEVIKNPRNSKILDWNEVVGRLEGVYTI